MCDESKCRRHTVEKENYGQTEQKNKAPSAAQTINKKAEKPSPKKGSHSLKMIPLLNPRVEKKIDSFSSEVCPDHKNKRGNSHQL